MAQFAAEGHLTDPALPLKGYQLLSDALALPQNYQYIRVRFKTEQFRLLDWASVACISESEKDLVVGRASKALIVDVLGQQCDLLHRFGRLDERFKPLTKPLLSDAQQQQGPQAEDSQTAAPDSHGVSAVSYPQDMKLMKKALSYVQATRRWGTRLRWAAFDQKSAETLLDKLSQLNQFLVETLSKDESSRLLELQVHTPFRPSLLGKFE